MLFHDWNVGREEGMANIQHERKDIFPLLCGRARKRVEKNATNATRFAPVFDKEIFVTPLLEARVVRTIVLVANSFYSMMEVNSVFLVKIVRSKVHPTA